jgi:hypothetical protein
MVKIAGNFHWTEYSSYDMFLRAKLKNRRNSIKNPGNYSGISGFSIWVDNLI